MKSTRAIAAACLLGMLAGVSTVTADPKVSLTATAKPEYTQRKYAGGKPKTETYVFMQGHYFDGVTVDRSIERMPFRRIAEYLAPELAKQQYLPTREIRDADLLIVVHWGTTVPYVSFQEMSGRTSAVTDTSTSFDTLNRELRLAGDPGDMSTTMPPVPMEPDAITVALLTLGDSTGPQLVRDQFEQMTDQMNRDMTRGNNIELLGYAEDLYRMRNTLARSEKERSLRYELSDERYFIILKAFDLRAKPEAGQSRRPVWTMHLNISSPGNNFRTAMDRMSLAAVNFFGRTTSEVTWVRPNVRDGKVNLAPMIILGETK